MYIPRAYRLKDRQEIERFLTHNPFGILTAYDGQTINAAHVPFEMRIEGERLVLDGHVARGNPIWRVAPNNAEVLTIFQGPHTYISPSWYRDPNVPTWDYVAVHLYGPCRLMDPDQLAAFLEKMVARYEAGRPHARLWDTLDATFREKQMSAIVGFSVDVTRIEAAAKMSQNRNDEDFHNIATTLAGSSLQADVHVSDIMKTIRPELFGGEPGGQGASSS